MKNVRLSNVIFCILAAQMSNSLSIGEMPERSIGLPWKGSVLVRVPGVRIPFSPPVA